MRMKVDVGHCFALTTGILMLASTSLYSACPAQGVLRQDFGQAQAPDSASGFRSVKLANLEVAVWLPQTTSPAPLIIFSHGFHGTNVQSRFLMEAMANDGYIVVAPNHDDARSTGGGGGMSALRPQQSFKNPRQWTDVTYKDRHDDIVALLSALKADDDYNRRIDWSRLALAGHSLGGYTVLGLGGAWPSWRLPGIKAILALSPYCMPYVGHDSLKNIQVPVMYQGGTRDFGITPSLKRSGGAFQSTASPCYFVEFDRAGHFSFSNLNGNHEQEKLISHYSLAFLDKFVKGQCSARPDIKLNGVSCLEIK